MPSVAYQLMSDFSEMWKHYTSKDEFGVASAFTLCEDFVNNVNNGSPVNEWLPKVRSSIIRVIETSEDDEERAGLLEALEFVDGYADTYGVVFEA